MLIPPEIRFRGMERTPALEEELLQKAEWLEKFCDRVTGCRVLVEKAHHHAREGSLYHVRIDLTVPGREIVVRRDPAEHHAHEDLDVAIRDAFDAARRRLEDYLRERRGITKTHAAAPRGRIARVFADRDYGFLATADGREVYFHRNSVQGAAFDALEPGTPVRFVEEPGVEGPQATMVRPVRRRAVAK